MGYVTVKFLGDEYQVSETINEFLHYDELLTPVRLKMLNTLSKDIKRDSQSLSFGSETAEHVYKITESYQNMMNECANIFVNKLFSLGIYDVTENELIEATPSIAELNELKMKTIKTMLSEGQKYVDMKNEGLENAYKSAASNITGSGVTVFSNSITTLLIHSVVEHGILMSQAKQADKEYEEAVRELNTSTRYALDKMVGEVMVKQYYPAVIDILMEFNTKITSAFLTELAQRGKFDFASIQNYNKQKADQMLSNISRVPDIVSFLKQTFSVCPFSFEVYVKSLEYGLLDKETFKTAEYFGFADSLAEKMDKYVNRNLRNKDLVNPIITILAEYRNTDETGIWRIFYKDAIEEIENSYRNFERALTHKFALDSFVREYISPDMTLVVSKTRDDVECIVSQKIASVLSEDRYLELIEMNLLSIEKLRKANSTASSLSEINTELSNNLVSSVMEYIEEANRRLKRFKESKAQLDKEIQIMRNELDLLQTEREKLSFFAFSKKKEMDIAIENQIKKIVEYENTHISKKFKDSFERMYS